MGCPTLETERLVLRPFGRADFDALATLHAQEHFWHYPFRRGWTREETERFLVRTMQLSAEGSFAVSAVVLRTSGELLGWAGLSIPFFLPHLLPGVEAGWRFGEQFQGRGYATEAGRAWIDHGFEHHDLVEILSIFDPNNTRSGGVMARLGFSFDHEAVDPTNGAGLHVMKLTRATWDRREPGRPPSGAVQVER